jgi:CheY-like chemotaxis protein/signal transduction histidine kinase/methyl-accepting chemotaxis protein
MNWIKDIDIRYKLFLLITSLLIPLVYFVADGVVEELRDRERLRNIQRKNFLMEVTADVLHEWQNERALSSGVIAAQGGAFRRRLNAQRNLTDMAISTYINAFNTSENIPAGDLLNDLVLYRQEIDAMKVDSLRFETFANNLINSLFHHIEDNASFLVDPESQKYFNAYINLLYAKTYLGTLRAVLSRSLTIGQFSYEEFGLFTERRENYITYLERFKRNAPAEILKYYGQATNNQVIIEVDGFLKDLANNPETNLSIYNPLIWFGNITSYISQLRLTEQQAMELFKDEIRTNIDNKNNLIIIYLTFTFSMLVLASFISKYVINLISDSLTKLKVAADKVALGYTDVHLAIDSKDEIGMLARSFNIVVDKNLKLSKVAEAIGKGNYDVEVEVLSEQDVLSNALSTMKDRLKKLSESDRKRNWILSGNADLNDLMRGKRSIEELANAVLKHLISYLNAAIGGFYLIDESNRLYPVAGHLNDSGSVNEISFRVGEGLVGRVASEKKLIHLDEIPEKYVKIRTGLTDIDPRDIVLVPLVTNNELIGVIELISTRKFDSIAIEFLKNISEKIALVFMNLKADLKTQELLYETQNQAEELETQQEELRQINDELREQKNKLQASEEELRVSQEELQEKNAELEEKANELEEQYEALNGKNKELEDARQAIMLKVEQLNTTSKYKSEFLANMSHELRTPLNSILILAGLIAENKSKNLTSKQIEFAEVIQKSGNDLLRLINEILDLARIESGKINLEIVPLNLKDIGIHKQFEPLAKEKQISFRVEYGKDLPETISTDQFRLEQILKNLLSNAFKFTSPKGKITLKVFRPDKEVEFLNQNLKYTDNIVAFEVSDTGMGIPVEKRDLIFEAFQQADTSTTRKFGGTGLGLSISRELATLLGGEIQLESEEGKGSCFTLYLPAERKVEEQHIMPVEISDSIKNVFAAVKSSHKSDVLEEEGDVQRDENAKKSILIIEDDKGFCKILYDFAKSKDFDVWAANNGLDGLRLAKKHRPDAILLDIQLPDINGWEVMERLKKEKELKNIPVHIMSAHDIEVLRKGILKENYLPKPITLEMLDKAFAKIREKNSSDLQKVLIIEDNEIENKAIKELLLSHELESSSAYSGKQALEILKNQDFDCIILDIDLPDMGGYDVLAKIRKESQNQTPVVIYSGKELSEEEAVKLKRYANTIVLKTQYSYTRLLDEIKLFLHKVQLKLPAEKQLIKLHRSEETLKGKKVLLVDDDMRNIYALYNVFEDNEMEVVVANNGLEALQKLEEHADINIVLMDIMMPEMDGLECTRRIRSSHAYNAVPIIALTAKAMKGDKEKCIQVGASDYISKPVDTEKLLSLLRVWLYDAPMPKPRITK